MTARKRRVPKRTCIVCRRSDAKRTFIRLVRRPDGTVAVDPQGRQPGRGAYVCSEDACKGGLEAGLISKALRAQVDEERAQELMRELRESV